MSQNWLYKFNSNLACVTGFQDMPYFKVNLNSHVAKNYVEFKFFAIECTENHLTDFIFQILHVYVTGHS